MSLMEYEVKIEGFKDAFLERHPEWVDFVIANDPALRKGLTPEEQKAQLRLYPGLMAIASWEEAHKLYKDSNAEGYAIDITKEGKPLILDENGQPYKADKTEARAIMEAAKVLSGGIDIHPATNLNWKTFIDHGTADVIGGDVSLGENAKLYSGVVLGNYGKKERDGHRHPQIGKNAIISTDVKIYGPCKIGNDVKIFPGARIIYTDIGDGVTIGPNVVLNEVSGGVPSGRILGGTANVVSYINRERNKDDVSLNPIQELLDRGKTTLQHWTDGLTNGNGIGR